MTGMGRGSKSDQIIIASAAKAQTQAA